ncbi:DUF2851 family protein [Chloroflexota bacterium]
MKKYFSESVLSELWKRGGIIGHLLSTVEGHALRVLLPGIAGDGRGPDYLGATVAWEDGRVVRGDVELHLESRGWQEHGHDRDPGYNKVILHVVFHHNSTVPTAIERGDCVPILALENRLGDNAVSHVKDLAVIPVRHPPCWESALTAEENGIYHRLSKWGENRFRTKALNFSRGFSAERPEQVLYHGILGALGYARNKVPACELARRLPLSAWDDFSGLMESQAVVLGTAGLLPSQRCCDLENHPWVEGLEIAWRHQSRGNAMCPGQWDFFRVRPANFPSRRLSALVLLVDRFRDGLLAGILGLVKYAANNLQAGVLEKGLMVAAEGYWERHWDFGITGSPAALVGRSRAMEVAINVLLPFAFAWGEGQPDTSLCEAALELYRNYPALQDNRITRHMKEKLWGKRRPYRLSAAQQQGLLYLHESFCLKERCEICPLATTTYIPAVML